MDFRFLRVLELLKEWISVAVALVTVLVAILTFLRARQVGGWKAFGLRLKVTRKRRLRTLNDLSPKRYREQVPRASSISF